MVSNGNPIADTRPALRRPTLASGDAEKRALVLPGDRKSHLIREALRGNIDRMVVTQDRLDDV